MVTEKENPPGDAVGLLPDGKINIGTVEEMKRKFEISKAESEAANLAAGEALEPDEEEAEEDGADL